MNNQTHQAGFLARGIGEALHHAYQGELEFHYNSDRTCKEAVRRHR